MCRICDGTPQWQLLEPVPNLNEQGGSSQLLPLITVVAAVPNTIADTTPVHKSAAAIKVRKTIIKHSLKHSTQDTQFFQDYET